MKNLKNKFAKISIGLLVLIFAVTAFAFIAWEDETEPPSPTAPTITTSSLPGGYVGEAYSQTLTATGTTPITWSIVEVEGEALPGGLTLSTAGVISGTPTTANTFTFTVKATNTVGSDTKTLTIRTRTPLPTPTNLSVSGTPSDTYLTLSWTPITESDCNGYMILRGTNSNNLSPSAGIGGGSSSTCTITGLTPNTTYYFSIYAIAKGTSNTYSDSSPSTPISVKTAP